MKSRVPLLIQKLSCILMIAGLLLCAGCGQRPVHFPAASSDSSASSSGTEAVFAPSDAGAAQEPVRRLTALSPLSIPSFAEFDENEVLSCWTEFTEDEENTTTYFDVLDLNRDEVVRSSSVHGYLQLEHGASGGSALLRSYDEDCFYLLDRELNLTRLDVPNTEGQFSPDLSRYYYTENGTLWALDRATGQRTVIQPGHDLTVNWISGIHPTRDYLAGWFCTSIFSYGSAYGLMDCSSGALLLLNEGLLAPSFYGDCFASCFYDYEGESARSLMIWGELNSDAPLNCVDITEYETQFSFFQLLSDSNYAVLISDYGWEGGEGAEETEPSAPTGLYRLDGGGLSVCSLADYGVEEGLLQAAYLPQSGLILAGSYQEGGCPITVIDPSALEFTDSGAPLIPPPERVDQEVLNAYEAELEVPELPSDLSAVQARAEELEARYDVTILLSGQCAAPCEFSAYDVTTTDQAGWEDEAAVIAQGLDALETALARYPTGFFRQFRSESGGDGVYFMPVGCIDSEEEISVAAFECGFGAREYIGFDCTLYDLTSNLYHEIWHATENKINRSEYEGFYTAEWDSCNPGEDAYIYSYAIYSTDADLWQWTYFGGSDEVYFVDDYSRTYPHEDRARIMEYLMNDGDYAQELMEHPAIRQKLQIMCEGIRAAFDTSEWATPRWERFF